MSAGLGTNPLTPLPPSAVWPILLAEGYASLAADWHLEWMPPATLEEGLEARTEIATQLAGRPGPGRIDQDTSIPQETPTVAGQPWGPSWLPPTSWHRSSVGSVAGTAPLARRPNPG